MFTKHPTSRCEFFVWGRSHSPEPSPATSEEVISASPPWSYGAPEYLDDSALASNEPQRPSPSQHLSGSAMRAGSQTTRNRGEPWPANHGHTKQNAGFTLVEVMVASTLALLVVAAIGSLSWYSSRSFAAIANYVDLDQASQLALDKMSQEVRQACQLVNYSPTSLSLLDVDKNPLQFIYDPEARTLVRVSNGETNRLLTGCDFLQFSKYQHTTISNTFDAYDPAYLTNTRLIQVTWVCSRKILGAKVNTESVQSAKIALRNN